MCEFTFASVFDTGHSEDFDPEEIVSALVMQEHASELQRLEHVQDPQLLLEGAIWLPKVLPPAQSTRHVVRNLTGTRGL